MSPLLKVPLCESCENRCEPANRRVWRVAAFVAAILMVTSLSLARLVTKSWGEAVWISSVVTGLCCVYLPGIGRRFTGPVQVAFNPFPIRRICWARLPNAAYVATYLYPPVAAWARAAEG